MQKWLFLIVAIVFLSLNHRSYAPPDLGCPPCELRLRIGVFERPGKIVFDRVPNAEFYYIQWAPSADGPWTNFTGSMGAWLDNIPAAGVGAITASVPMFYRVSAWVPTNGLPDPGVMSFVPATAPAGGFVMGNTFTDDLASDEIPLHTNTISEFYIDKYEVTKALWDEVVAFHGHTNGYLFSGTATLGLAKDTNHPIGRVTWYDAVKWCNARSEMEGLRPVYYGDSGLANVYKSGVLVSPYVDWAANGYRLPTEAEWERAARGGVAGQRFPWGNFISHSNANYYSYWVSGSPDRIYDVSSVEGHHPAFEVGDKPYTSPVGSFAPNGFGLYDMAGNVSEWCWDWYDSNYYIGSPSMNPVGPTNGTHRVIRGGAYVVNVNYDTRVSARNSLLPAFEEDHIGFRCVRRR